MVLHLFTSKHFDTCKNLVYFLYKTIVIDLILYEYTILNICPTKYKRHILSLYSLNENKYSRE